MCTHFTLHYACKHVQAWRRCPKNTAAAARKLMDNNGSHDPAECGNIYYMEGKLNDNCIECKVSHGIPPGSERSGLREWLEGIGVRRRFSLLLPKLPQVNSSQDVGLGGRSIANVARDDRNVNPQLFGESGLGTNLPPGEGADFQQADKWQTLQDLDPRLLNQPEPERHQRRRLSDNAELGAAKGPDTRTTCQRRRAATVTHDIGHGVTQSNPEEIETGIDPVYGARLVITQEPGGSDRIRSIFEQLNGEVDIHDHITNANKQGYPATEVSNMDPTLLLENKQDSGLKSTASGISGGPRPCVYPGDPEAEGSRADSPYGHDIVEVVNKDPTATIGRGRKRSRVETKDAESVDNTKEAGQVKALKKKKKEADKRKRQRAA